MTRVGRLPAAGLAGCLVVLGAACSAAPPAPPPGAYATAIVVVHRQGELAPQLAEPDLELLRRDAGSATTGAPVHVIAAGRAAAETIDVVGRRPNGRPEFGPRRPALVEENLAVVQDAVDRAAREGTDGDILRALDAASRSGATRVILMTSGLSTTDPFDLRVTGFDRDPATLAAELSGLAALPRLTGIRVILSGLGRTTDPQPALGAREQTRLRSMWMSLCRATGAICGLHDAERPARPAVSSLPAQVVEVLRMTTTPGPDTDQVISVPATLLFAPDSCEIDDRAAAAAVLASPAGQLRAGGAVVSISGRTAPVGPGTGVELSECRAQATAELLRADLDVPSGAIGEIRGDGSLLDPPSASRDATGRFDPTSLPGLRRVVLTVTKTEPGTWIQGGESR